MTGAWPMVSLGEICEIQRGGSPRPISSYTTESEDGINWIKIGDVAVGAKYLYSTEERIKPEGAKRSRMVYPGDFILSNSMSFGRPYIMRTSGCIHDGWLVLRDTDKRLSEDYLYRVLGSDFVVSQFKKMAVGAVVKNLNKEVVQAVVIPLPPLPEQRRIAAILDQADALRAKRREALAQLDSLTQSIFIEMFGDPKHQIEAGMCSLLSDVVAPGRIVTYGIVQAGPEVEDGVPYIRTGDIKNGVILEDRLSRTSSEIAESYSRSAIKTGDIVMSIRATVGTTALVPDSLDGANLTQGTARISPGDGVQREYLLSYLRTNSTQAWIQSNVKGATFREITLGKLRQLPVVVPSIELQNKFAERIAVVNSLTMSAQRSLAETNFLFASLQHRAFRGEL